MPKSIVILCDGTSNEISNNRTNVLRLYGTLEKDEGQLVYYDPGVGTFGAEGAWLWFWRKAVEIFGLATGWGLDQNVKEAYRFLIENHEDGDQIYILGFSRGAYTARVLAGFIRAMGFMRRNQLNLLDYAYRAYKRIGETEDKDAFAEIELFDRILQPKRPSIRALGLFDTVSSMFEWGRYWLRLRRHAFTKTNSAVVAVRHAVAIHEARVMFRPQSWPEDQPYRKFWKASESEPQDNKEVWFRGVHGDIGGGYPEKESGLAKIPLHWMIREMKTLGLRFDDDLVKMLVLGEKETHTRPDATARVHDSMTWAWKILEILPLRGNPPYLGTPSFCRPREIEEGARIHQSVIDNANDRGGPLPPSVPNNHRVEP